MAKAPSFQFYPGDWLKDPSLSMCRPATRGIWMDLICAAHELARCGQITGTPDQIARICRCTSADFIAAAEELQSTGTADIRERAGVFTITNRRMRREWQEREDARLRQQKKRGNFGNFAENSAEKIAAKSRQSHIVTKSGHLATFEQKEDVAQAEICHEDLQANVTPYSSSSSSTSVEELRHIETPSELRTFSLDKQDESIPPEPEESVVKKRAGSPYADQVRDLFAYWQEVLNHPGAKLTTARRRVIESRLREGYTIDDLKRAIDGCRASAWHMGANDNGTVYDDLELICRNGGKVEQFKARLQPAGTTNGGANGIHRNSPAGNSAKAFEQAADRIKAGKVF